MFTTSSAEASSADVIGQKTGSKAGALPPIAAKPFGARARRRSKLQQQQPHYSSSPQQNRHEEDSSSSFLLWGSTTEPQNEETRAPVVESSSKNKNSTNVRESVPSEDASSVLATLFRAGGETKKQRKIVYKAFGNDPLKLLEMVTEDGIPEPESERDVVIKVAACTVSYSDCMIRRGHNLQHMSDPISLPVTPGGDIVGNIVKVGSRVRHFKVGDRVAALVRTGGNARYISVPATHLVSVPRSCDSAEAACMISTFMTAYQAVRLVTKDQFTMHGKHVLVTGGIEPIGQALIQLCFRAGATQVYATAPANRHKYIQSVLGAHPLPVEPKDWLPHTKGQMDVVFDGKCHDGLTSPYASLRPDGGVLICVGMTALLGREQPGVFGAPLSAYWSQIKGQLLLSKSKTYEVWDSFKENREAFKLDLEILFHLLKKRFIKPHIAKRIALSDVGAMHDCLEKENVRGQIVCIPWKRK